MLNRLVGRLATVVPRRTRIQRPHRSKYPVIGPMQVHPAEKPNKPAEWAIAFLFLNACMWGPALFMARQWRYLKQEE